VIRVRQGLYVLPSLVPGLNPVHEFEIAMALVSPAAISHWSALHHHGLTQQIPRKVFVLTTTQATVPRRRSIQARETEGYPVGDTHYQFVQVKPARYFGVEKVWINDIRVAMTDPERTLIDGLTMPRYCGDFAEVLQAFAARLPLLDLDRIIAYALRLDVATAKRLGWVLEYHRINPSRLRQLEKVPIKGYRKLNPTGPAGGPYHQRWMIQENLLSAERFSLPTLSPLVVSTP
jgi:predicted transcriptional regulator of viral defense system